MSHTPAPERGRLRTRRWNDPRLQGDGLRVLVCRFRPRGLPKADEPWDAWAKELGPSGELHAERYGKRGAPLPWAEYRQRYLGEMTEQTARIGELAERLRQGESVTLLCSSACVEEAKCHRSLLAGLIERALLERAGGAGT